MKAKAFVTPTPEYWEFIKTCRVGRDGHYGAGEFYDVVYGPVSLYPQKLVIWNMEQVSFHTFKAVLQLQIQNVYLAIRC